jgi:hypothetical protein
MVDVTKIRMFMTSEGAVIGEHDQGGSTDALVKLKYPFRVIPGGDGKVTVAALFYREDWCIISPLTAIEVSVAEGFKDMYEQYVQEVHGLIVSPKKSGIII